jgi:hypothetical protein
MNTSEIPALTETELKLLQTLVYQECGMHFDDRRTPFLQDRLLRRMKECELDSFYSYYRLLISQPGKQELFLSWKNSRSMRPASSATKRNWNCFSGT